MENNYKIFEELAATYNSYKKSFKKAGVDYFTLCELHNHFKIIETITHYEKGIKQPAECKEISTQYFANTLTWICCMNDRVYKKAVGGAGYIAYKLISKSPFEEGTKTVREYSYIKIN